MFKLLRDVLTQEVAADGFEYRAGTDAFGPTGVAFLDEGRWLVANGATDELYLLERLGVSAGVPIAPEAGLMDLCFDLDGRLYGTRWGFKDIVEVEPETGTVLRVVRDGFEGPAAIVLDPVAGELLVSDFSAHRVVAIDPGSGDQTVRADADTIRHPDGIAVASDGRLFVACPWDLRVVCVERDGTVREVAQVDGKPDGIALARDDAPLRGSIVVSLRNGDLATINTAGQLTVIATDGTPADLLTVDRDGYLYVTQIDQVVRIGPGMFQPTSGSSWPMTLG